MIKIKLLKEDLPKYADKLNDLLHQLSPHSDPPTKEEFLEFVKDDDFYIFGAFSAKGGSASGGEGQELVGIATITFFSTLSNLTAEIDEVVVDEKYRGQGISMLLLEKLLDTARELVKKNNKKLKIFLTSRPSREEANHLYKKIGFRLLAAATDGGTNYYRLVIEP